jgi:hypothetical protein
MTNIILDTDTGRGRCLYCAKRIDLDQPLVIIGRGKSQFLEHWHARCRALYLMGGRGGRTEQGK